MLLEDARQIINENIYTDRRHIDYTRTVDIDADALTYASGENMDRLLIRNQNESDAAYKQRLRLTCGITAEVLGGLEAPINDVVQNDMVRKGIRLDNERQVQIIQQMFKSWNGKGIENYLKTRFKDLQLTGANTWIVPEWKTPQTPTEIVEPQPFEVPAAWAYNFEFTYNTLKWLLVGQPIIYLKKKAVEEKKQIHVEGADGKIYKPPFELPEWLQHQKVDGIRYTLYTDMDAIVYEQVDKDYYLPQDNDLEIVEIKSGKYYAVRVYAHNLGFVPGFRIGYMDDPLTAGRTKVPFWHQAKNTLRKSLLTVSNMDMSEVIQAFPRHTRYVTQCNGDGQHACNKGYQAGSNGVLCKTCAGTGMQDIKNPQEEIIIPLPVDPTKDQILDLKAFSNWDAPPSDILDFMAKRVAELEPRAHKAVYGTETLIQKSEVKKTATEDDNDQKRIQTALEPFAEKISEVYRFMGYLFGKLAGASLEKMDVYYEFQGDLYRRGKLQLINQIKTATDAGAPSFIIDQINETLADIQFAGDPFGRQKVKVQSYFWPFSGKSNAQIEFLFASNLVEKFDQVLFTYFDPIFKELELDNAGFYYITDKNVQWALLEAKVLEFIERKKQEVPEVALPALATM